MTEEDQGDLGHSGRLLDPLENFLTYHNSMFAILHRGVIPCTYMIQGQGGRAALQVGAALAEQVRHQGDGD